MKIKALRRFFFKHLLTSGRYLKSFCRFFVTEGICVSISTKLKVVVDLLTMTHTAAFENTSKWKGGKERDEDKDE